jgi:cytochrome oxidase Cu insertion factor (SCO1/SenC/PrrC family)
MPGMNSGLSPNDPTLEAAFRSALMRQGLIALAVFVLLWLIWGALRNWVPAAKAGALAAEPRGRQVLRIGFGLLWVFDGILQAQPQMPGGLPSQVIEPAAQSSPRWVQEVVNAGGTIWSYHPIQAAAAAVWIQIGIGVWLLAAVRGRWSRAAGLISVAWGLVVWVFGEAFGGIFAPGLSWLNGAPGSVLLYCVAGALIALPLTAWRAPRAGRLLLAGTGVFFLGMAVLQAWPGRGFWTGGAKGTLTGMVAQMAETSQPRFLSDMVAAFGSFTAAHGFTVNLFVVIALAVLGAALLTGRPRLVRAAVIAATVVCLATWVLVQDFGFLGGLGTDPNSMIPMIVLLAGGYLALTRLPAAGDPATTEQATAEQAAEQAAPEQAAPEQAAPEQATPGQAGRWPDLLRPDRVRAAIAATSVRTVTALGGVAVVALGAAPMAAASVNSTADPVIAEAIAGYSPPLDIPASPFRLTDQRGQTVTLASLRGKVVLLTFLDPVCTTDCPIIAQEFKAAGTLLGAQARQVDLVAIAANPTYYSTEFTQAFTGQEGLSDVPNWLYLTGTLAQLRSIWNQYGVDVEDLPAGAMSAHNDLAIVIDPSGHIRQEIDADPGPATTSSQSSFAVLLASAARQALSQ